ncbi:MAG: hypothetical protein E7631_00790 [Ruminococcaceae bacterium]|nr:hypothetical protein [Oscillospiraceae bacterium]
MRISMLLSRKNFLAAALLFFTIALLSCGKTEFPVDVLAIGESGAQITGEHHKQVACGDSVSFTLTLPAGETVAQVFLDDILTDAYTWENNVLTLPEILSPTTVRIVSGNPAKQVYWEADSSSRYGGTVHSNVKPGPVAMGSMVTLTAETYEGAVFLGWSDRFMLRSGGELISESEQVTVEINDYTFICANFDISGVIKPEEKPAPVVPGKNTRTIFYNSNGGNRIEDTKAALETTFDTSYWTMPFAREDDGKLQKDGYVLLGYSFDPDGSGELIRPGYKYRLPNDDTMLTLYAVWQKETDPSLFTTAALDEKTVSITGYSGTDSTVYIPRTIDGKTVVRIAKNAFAGNQHLQEIYITPTILQVEKDAFVGCANLTAVTMYDSLREISDASFPYCPITTVRLCAATAPRYIDSGQTYGKKFERLMNTAGTERIIVVSGSSKHCGLDTDYLETLVHEDYSIVNFGTNATMSILFFLESVSSYLTETDILVYAPEQYGPYAYYTNGNPELPSSTFQGFATCCNLLERIDVSSYTNVFDAFAEYNATRLKMSPVAWDSHTGSIDEYGDYAHQRTTLQDPSFHYKANGDFRFNETVIPAAFLPNMNRVLDKAAQTGAQIWFSFPPHNRNAVLKDSLQESAYDGYAAFLRENVHALLISDVRDHIYDGIYFDDTDYHLNIIGREMHTSQLAEDLIAAGVREK